jgi:hypothetical protein
MYRYYLDEPANGIRVRWIYRVGVTEKFFSFNLVDVREAFKTLEQEAV